LIAALARPVAYNCLSLEMAPALLAQFTQCGKQAEAFVKVLLAKIRERTADDEWKSVFVALKKVPRLFFTLLLQIFLFFFYFYFCFWFSSSSFSAIRSVPR
jgi:hypothetical protein